MKLQRPTKVSNAGLDSQEHGIATLKELAATSTRSVFISWKWCDNIKEWVKSLAYALAENGFMPWLDLLALPRARALKKVQEDEEKLERLLRYGYQRCLGVIGVESANYGIQSDGSDKNWTLREWEGALVPERPLARIVYRQKGATRCGVMPRADVWLSCAHPHSAAKELRNWLHNRSKAD